MAAILMSRLRTMEKRIFSALAGLGAALGWWVGATVQSAIGFTVAAGLLLVMIWQDADRKETALTPDPRPNLILIWASSAAFLSFPYSLYSMVD